ncbi:MAG: YIP1 family protein [Geobacteraceae bacterium]|nr:YIP1 family protein [Geobacteraceae bacterium]
METRSIDFAAIPQTAIKVVTSPAEFFREMPKTGGFVEPLVFLVVMGALSGVIGGLLLALSNISGFNLYPGTQMGATAIILLPIMYAIGFAIFGFVTAAILFVIWKLMGSGESYETAYRCVAYLAALSPITTLLGVIPYLGGAIGLVIITFYFVTASVQTHGIPAQRAWIVFGILAAIFIVFSVSAQIAARRFARNMEQATESWKGASEEMQKAAEEMQKKMEEELKKNQQSLPQSAEQMQEPAQDMQKSAQEMQNAAKELQKQMEEQLKKQKQ